MGCWSPVLTSCSGAGAGVSGGRQKPPAEREPRGRMAPAPAAGRLECRLGQRSRTPSGEALLTASVHGQGEHVAQEPCFPGVPCVFAEHLPQELRLVRGPALHCNCTKSNPSAQTPLPLCRWGRRGTERRRLPFEVTRLTCSAARSPAGMIRPESLPSERLHWWSRS